MAALALAGCQTNKTVSAPKSAFSGLIKTDVSPGTGPVAEDGDTVFVTYTGRLHKNQSIFDSNDPSGAPKSKVPLMFVVGKYSGMIDGMWQGVLGMKQGGKRQINIPYSLGYGEQGNATIPSYADLTFDVSLLYVIKKGEENTVEVEDIKVGTGPVVTPTSTVSLDYVGKFVNDVPFDSTYDRGQPVTFPLGKDKAISGFEKGLEGMRAGGKRRLLIPPAAAWGAAGKDVIPANQMLVYEVDLLGVK